MLHLSPSRDLHHGGIAHFVAGTLSGGSIAVLRLLAEAEVP